ncbi:MAG: hypothetical protein Q9220_001117 [cf. Caloplaca sp. 1 TL-2023]
MLSDSNLTLLNRRGNFIQLCRNVQNMPTVPISALQLERSAQDAVATHQPPWYVVFILAIGALGCSGALAIAIYKLMKYMKARKAKKKRQRAALAQIRNVEEGRLRMGSWEDIELGTLEEYGEERVRREGEEGLEVWFMEWRGRKGQRRGK